MKGFAFGAAAALLVCGAYAWMVHVDRPTPAVLAALPRPDDEEPVTTDSKPADGPLVALPDLSRVDRSLVKHPGWHNPRYCLLVFGRRQPKTRVWLVEDGDTLYVDRDGTGTFTDPAKAFQAVTRHGDTADSPYREWTYKVGELAPDGGREKHSQVQVIRCQTKGEAPHHIVFHGRVRVDGRGGPVS